MASCKEPLSGSSIKYSIGVFESSIPKETPKGVLQTSIQKEHSQGDFHVSHTANIWLSHFLHLIRS